MLSANDVYYGKIFINERLRNMLSDYGVIILGKYNTELKCFNCIFSGVVNDRLMILAQEHILGFDGTVVSGLKSLIELLSKEEEEK